MSASAPAAVGHACYSGEPNNLCEAECPDDGFYHSHQHEDGGCENPLPCSSPGCHTIEGLCRDFPTLEQTPLCRDVTIP